MIQKAGDIGRFKKGSILVTKITNPAFMPAMVQAVGIITDIGGITSHPAIISRELGIPCVVSTKDATSKLKTGQKVLLDANKGIVYQL